jgi:anti-anti-sigma factor
MTDHVPFDVEIRPADGRTFVVPRGDLDLATADRVAASIDELVTAGCGEIVLDLRHLTFMDSAGLRLVVQQTRRSDRTVCVIDGTPPVSRLFDLTGMRAHLPFFTPDGEDGHEG